MNLRALLGVLTQGLWSGLSFLVAIIVARYASIDAFGWFAVGLAVKQLLLMPLGAVVLTPLTVTSGRHSLEALRDSRLHRNVITIFQFVSLVSLVFASLIGWIIAQPAIEFALFVVGGLAVELQRRINFINQRSDLDLFGGVINIVGVLVALLILNSASLLTVPNIFLVVGVTNLLWTITCNARHWLTFSSEFSPSELLDLWRIGRWCLASNVAGYVYAQSSTFFTLYLIGPKGVAVLELGRQLVNVVLVFVQGMANFWQPKLARSAATDDLQVFAQLVWRVTRLQTVGGAGALIILLLVIPFLLPLLVPGKEQDYALAVPTAWILALALIFQLVSQHPNFALIALGKPKADFLARLIAALILLPLGFGLIYLDSVSGAAWSRVIGEVIVMVITTKWFHQTVRLPKTLSPIRPSTTAQQSAGAE